MPTGFPVWIAYIAWTVTTAVGIAGYYAVCNGYRLLGFAAMGLYASYGLLAFGHYTLAPISAHTLVQNATILSEALTALLLLGTVMVFLVKDRDA
jgi:heme exporter protein D